MTVPRSAVTPSFCDSPCPAQVVGASLLPEAVTWFYASVLKGLQMHGQHEGCGAALTQLAFLIYEALVSVNRPLSVRTDRRIRVAFHLPEL